MGASRLHSSWDLAYWASGSCFPWARWTDPSVFCKDSLRNFRGPRRLSSPRFRPVTVRSPRLISGEIFPGPPSSPLSSPCSLGGWSMSMMIHNIDSTLTLNYFQRYFLTFHVCFHTFVQTLDHIGDSKNEI